MVPPFVSLGAIETDDTTMSSPIARISTKTGKSITMGDQNFRRSFRCTD